MQTTHSAHPAQPYQNKSGLFLVGLLSLGAFLLYAVQTHLITDAFVTVLSLFFDKFSVKSTSSLADIALLILFSLATLGLYNLFKSFFSVAVLTVVLTIAFAFGG